MADNLTKWAPLKPEEAAHLLSDLPVQWWIAGGWAIDLFLGRETRPHSDLDVLVLRSDQAAVRSHLENWDLQACDPPGQHRPWKRGEWLPVGVHDIWCRRAADEAWTMQIMLMEDDGDRWYCRRDRRVGGSVDSLGMTSSKGIPILRPEIQLLFKATGSIREKDVADLEATLPRLDPQARSWLCDSLKTMNSGHQWLSRIGG